VCYETVQKKISTERKQNKQTNKQKPQNSTKQTNKQTKTTKLNETNKQTKKKKQKNKRKQNRQVKERPAFCLFLWFVVVCLCCYVV
jgi:Flp pilus assembly protein TadB